MAKEISWEIRFHAEELYIANGLTFEQVSDATGVSISQLKRWAKESGWREKRKEHRQALSDIKRDSVQLRQRLIKNAMDTLDPQAVYAAARFEAVAASILDKSGDSAEHVSSKALKNIKTPQDAIEALQEVIERKINIMLTKPDGITLSKIKEMKQALELIEKMTAKYSKDKTAKTKGLSDEAAENIRKKIMGISKK